MFQAAYYNDLQCLLYSFIPMQAGPFQCYEVERGDWERIGPEDKAMCCSIYILQLIMNEICGQLFKHIWLWWSCTYKLRLLQHMHSRRNSLLHGQPCYSYHCWDAENSTDINCMRTGCGVCRNMGHWIYLWSLLQSKMEKAIREERWWITIEPYNWTKGGSRVERECSLYHYTSKMIIFNFTTNNSMFNITIKKFIKLE